jgi:hypothetical protein
MALRAYVASTTKNVDNARKFIEQVKGIGLNITHNWTDGLDIESELTPEELSSRVEFCIHGAKKADLFIYLDDDRASLVGSMIELGSFLSVSCRFAIVVTNAVIRNNFFLVHCSRIVTVESEEEALDIIRLAKSTFDASDD